MPSFVPFAEACQLQPLTLAVDPEDRGFPAGCAAVYKKLFDDRSALISATDIYGPFESSQAIYPCQVFRRRYEHPLAFDEPHAHSFLICLNMIIGGPVFRSFANLM